jgi:tRNA-dihydrouridine synthase
MPRAKEMIDAVGEGAPHLPLSVKTRLGNRKNIADTWIPFLLEQKLAALTIHGRTGKELSEVPAHWDEIGKVVEMRNRIAPETLLIGNGDVTNYVHGVELSQKYGVDGVMIARGIFHNPWAFETKDLEHGTEDYLDILIKHLNLYEETWKGTKNFAIMKKFFKMYVNSFPGAGELRAKLMECKNYVEVANLLS